MKRNRYCQLPVKMTITGRSSSITNAFINTIIPVIVPSDEEELEALGILNIDPSDIRCAYCGDKATEWDHLRPIITDKKPTGYITEIANLVPSCGKCTNPRANQIGIPGWKVMQDYRPKLVVFPIYLVELLASRLTSNGANLELLTLRQLSELKCGNGIWKTWIRFKIISKVVKNLQMKYRK